MWGNWDLGRLSTFSKSYISSNWQGWNLNLHCDLNPVFLPFILFHLSSKDLYEDLNESNFHWNVGNLFDY